MMFDGLTNGLRWIFWGIVYLSVLVTALIVVAMLPLPTPVRLGFMLVFVWGIALDVQRKREPETA
jgi:hypothetical protein